MGYGQSYTDKREGILNSSAILGALGEQLNMQVKQKRDNTEIYKKITEVDDQMVK